MRILGRSAAIAAAVWAAGAGLVAAQVDPRAPVVVELFTSQGCSACPPADAFMAELVRQPGVIALALHVDYWDYLGWRDPFGKPAFSERQKRYAKAAGMRMVYTPQIIVAGSGRVEGFRPDQIRALIADHGARDAPVRLAVERNGAMVRIEASAEPPLPGAAMVQLVRFHPGRTVTIESGENEGHTGTYVNIVTDWQVLGEWSGQAPLVIEARAEGKDRVAVIVQEPGPGRVLAAMKLP